MAQKEIEVILARQLAEYLTLPIFIVDPNGDLLYYNEPAEEILGSRFGETGPIAATQPARHPAPEVNRGWRGRLAKVG